MNTPTGTLKVSVASTDPYAYDSPISVLDRETLQLVKSSTCNQEISLPIGTYVVSTTLPSGERSSGVAEVVSGELAELALSVEQPTASAAAPSLESLGPAAQPVTRSATVSTPWHVRFFVPGQAGGYEPEEANVTVVSRSPERVELEVQASGNGILFVQVATPGETPLNVALPIYGPTISQQCRLTIAQPDPPKTTVSVSLPDNPKVDAIARYLKGGHLREAADLSADAEQLLESKMADPFGAALGGYALLKLGRLDKLHHWPRNLADFFPWLPDGAVIAAEESALEGDHQTAIVQVCEAARRGLPVFSDGLSLLSSRLREYASAPKSAFPKTADRIDEAGRLLEPVLRVMAFTDFDRVSLAFRGEAINDPASSQTPVSDFGSAGWRNVGEL